MPKNEEKMLASGTRDKFYLFKPITFFIRIAILIYYASLSSLIDLNKVFKDIFTSFNFLAQKNEFRKTSLKLLNHLYSYVL